ncbi:MAG: glycosyltransferase family 39 protein [Elusimicrobiota bacterium]
MKHAPLILILALGLAAGLCGIRSGLPGPQRWRALPPALNRSPEFAGRLADSWRRLYEGIRLSHETLQAEEPVTYVQGLVTVAPGWTFPPEPLINSARSLMTQSESPDEKKSFIILSRMRPWKLQFEPLYAQYGGAFIYPFGAFLGAAHLSGLARLTPDLTHYLIHPEDMGRLYLLGRVFILLFHLGTLWVLYETGLLLGGLRAAAGAALLFCAAPFVAIGSHALKPHPVSAFWFAAAAYYMIRAVEKGDQKNFLSCGACAGMAAGGSLTLIFAAGMPLLARASGGRGSWRQAFWGAAVAVGVIVAFNPYLFFSPRTFAWELSIYSPTRWGVSPEMVKEMTLRGLPRGVGLLSTALMAAGVAFGLVGKDRRRRAVSWTALIVTAFLWLRFSQMGNESLLRVFYAPFALACLMGAALLPRLPPAAAGLVLLLALAESGARASTYLANLSVGSGRASTRELAADWIDTHIPAGASLGLLRLPEPAHTPPFRWDRLELRIFDSPRAVASRLPDWIAASSSGWQLTDVSLRQQYLEVERFSSRSPLTLAMTDGSFFSNIDFVILRKKDSRHNESTSSPERAN